MISKSKDLATMAVATLFGKLREYELELERLKDEEFDKKKKGLALKQVLHIMKLVMKTLRIMKIWIYLLRSSPSSWRRNKETKRTFKIRAWRKMILLPQPTHDLSVGSKAT